MPLIKKGLLHISHWYSGIMDAVSKRSDTILGLMVNKPLRILHLEDNGDYSDLVRALLEREGLNVQIKHVVRRIDFESALAEEKFDIILADYLLPEWNGLEALRCAREKLPETPFLLVSGTIG